MKVSLHAAAIVELFSTFALCFVGISALHFADRTSAGLLVVAVSQGLALACIVTAAIPTSGGHANPAVTIGFLITGKIRATAAMVYVLAQLAGATLAAGVVYAMLGGGLTGARVVFNGTPQFDPQQFSTAAALVAEIVASLILVAAVWGSAADPRARGFGGFAIGLAYAAGVLAVGPISGAAMNPARAFGPTLFASFFDGLSLWHQHWVYWIGPVVGGSLAALVYHLFLWPRDRARNVDPDSMQVPPNQRP